MAAESATSAAVIATCGMGVRDIRLKPIRPASSSEMGGVGSSRSRVIAESATSAAVLAKSGVCAADLTAT